MENNILFLPILIPFAAAVANLLLWQRTAPQRAISVAGSAGLLISALAIANRVLEHGPLAVQAGNWPAPYGITLVVDTFSAVMLCMTGLMGLLVAVYRLGEVQVGNEVFGYHPLYNALLMGVAGAFSTGDLFNLFVWFEVMLISSFVLLALGGARPQIEGAFKYVSINLVSSALFLSGLGLVYGLAGTLNMADLARTLPTLNQPGMVTTIGLLFMVSFGIKAALFPLFFWLPASYHTPPVSVTVIFSALLSKVGVYALVRVFTLVFVAQPEVTLPILTWVAGLTMAAGVLGAVSQYEMRRLLSFHVISQIGYMIVGLALFTPLSLAATVYFLVQHICTKSALFMVSGIVRRQTGSFDLREIGGLYKGAPLLSGLFLLAALSLAGIPPLSGFWAKYALVRAGLEGGQYGIVAAALLVGMLTLYSMTKIWAEAFWKKHPAGKPAAKLSPVSQRNLLGPIVVLVGLVLVLGLAAGPLYEIALQAANELLTPEIYIQTVLGGG